MYDIFILLEEEADYESGAWATPEDLLKLSTFVQQDVAPVSFPAAYLFGNTPDLEQSIIERGALLYTSGAVSTLCIAAGSAVRGANDPDGHIVYRGGDTWREELISKGVLPQDIAMVARPDPVPHTGTEAMRFIGLIQEVGWNTVGIVAHPTHILRAFVSTVTWVVRKNLPIKLYSIPSSIESWQEKAPYSQAGEEKKRIDFLEGELQRLNRWHAKGDLISGAEVLQYLAERDA